MTNMKRIFGLIALAFIAFGLQAREDVPRDGENMNRDSYRKAMKFGSDCDPATQSADLDVNNVRTKILNGGDMWWDLSNPKYEIPKIEDLNSVRKHSLFAGAIWIGGVDLTGNLKLAAMTYRQRGSDFWPGPLDEVTGNTNSSVCLEYDQIYKVDGPTIIEHSNEFQRTGFVATPNTDIANWPGRSFDRNRILAPFFDADGDGMYDPRKGDYPVLQNECKGAALENAAEDQPDQMLWFVYNDKGNIHSETQGEPIGVELQTTAFAFATNDEINDMTFYTTRIINRGATQLKNTYFGQWVDPDLGNYVDDYVGCDVGLSLGFCYNGDDNDEGVLGYGLNPPSIGVDFFEGPVVDSMIDGVMQKVELGMSHFVYYNNNQNPINGNPNTASQFYNLLRAKWLNGDDITYGEDGVGGTEPANYMFPGNTDPAHSEPWTEEIAGNLPADRRFLQSSGPFILEPGAVQRLTVGVVWAKSSFGGATGSLGLLKVASQKAQELFNSCFDLVDGPDAPEIEVQELDQQLVFSFGNTNSERVEGYEESVVNGFNELETYTFQGYRIFQLKDGTVSLSELDDVTKAREVFQCDIQDDVAILINKYYDPDVEQEVPRREVSGSNEGLAHTVSLTTDAFATGSNKTLVNFKNYYYIVLAYASGESRNREYLEGRKVKKFSASPRKTEPRMGGSNVRSTYGSGPKIVRLAGKGNGGKFAELTEESTEYILSNNYHPEPMYDNGFGPVNVTVVDPLKVKNAEYELTLVDTATRKGAGFTPLTNTNFNADGVRWILVRTSSEGEATSDTIWADTTIAFSNEQVILESTTGEKIFDWGLAVTITQVDGPGDDIEAEENGLIGWEVIFEDPSSEWLTAIPDRDATQAAQFGYYDWIRSGVQGQRDNFNDPSWHDYAVNRNSVMQPLDAAQAYEGIWGGRVAPYRLVANNATANGRDARFVQAMAYNLIGNNTIGLENLHGIDLVITPDESKWSEVIILEMGEDPGLNQNGAEKFDLRDGPLVNYNGRTLKPGKTMFPGYAINVETGQRLNIIVTEDSYQIGENGRDMFWNPTDNAGFYNSAYPSMGGRHYIYVMGSHQGPSGSIHPELPIYDGGERYWDILTNGIRSSGPNKSFDLTAVFQNCMWVVPTYLSPGNDFQTINGIPAPYSEFKLKVRVNRPYENFGQTAGVNFGNPKYKFSTNDISNEISDENATNALEMINIVPNPYYAVSGYETSPIDNRVKFTNLPKRCDISIYTLDGSLVRRIKKDDENTDITWDLKNSAGVPIASGLYIIHVDAFELGEKKLKWMGIMRELDLDSF